MKKKRELDNTEIWEKRKSSTAAEYEVGYPAIDISPWVEIPILYSEKG